MPPAGATCWALAAVVLGLSRTAALSGPAGRALHQAQNSSAPVIETQAAFDPGQPGTRLRVCAFHAPPLMQCPVSPHMPGEGSEEVKWRSVALLAGEEWEKVCVANLDAAKASVMSGSCDIVLSVPVTADLMPDLAFSQPTFSGGIQAVTRRATEDFSETTEDFSELLNTVWTYAQLFDWPLLASVVFSSCLVSHFVCLLERCNLNSPLRHLSFARSFLETWWCRVQLQCYFSRFLALVWLITSALASVVFVAHFTVRLIPHIAGGGFAHEVVPRASFPVHGARVGVQSGDKDQRSVTQFLDEVGATLRELPADSYQSGLADLHSGKLDILLVRSPLAEFLLSQDCALDSSPLQGSTQNFALAYKRNKLEFAATALRIEIALAEVLEGRVVSTDWDASGMRETVQQNCSKEDDMLRRQRGTSEEWQARPIEFGGSIGWAKPGTMGWVVVAAHAGVLVAAFLFCLVLVLCGMVCLCTKSPCQVCTKLSANESSLILRSDLPPPQNVAVLEGDGHGEGDKKSEGAEEAQDAPDMESDVQLKTQLDSMPTDKSVLERDISDLKISIDKVMTGQSLLFRRLKLHQDKMDRTGKDKDGGAGVQHNESESQTSQQQECEDGHGKECAKAEDGEAQETNEEREQLLRDKPSRMENLRARERERERERVKARENRGKADRKLLISALDELRDPGTTKKPASNHLSPPSPGDVGLKSGDGFEQPMTSFQRRSHSDVASYQARNTGFKEAMITPASALSGFMGTVGGLLEGAAAAVTNVAGSGGASDGSPARQGIRVAGARRRLGGVPTPSKQEVESAFAAAKYGPAEVEGGVRQQSQMGGPRPASHLERTTQTKALGAPRHNAGKASSMPAAKDLSKEVTGQRSLLPAQLPPAVLAPKAQTATKSREQEAGKASTMGLPDLPADFATDKAVLDTISKRPPHPQDSTLSGLSELVTKGLEKEKGPEITGNGGECADQNVQGALQGTTNSSMLQ